jgi:hypothetical protein
VSMIFDNTGILACYQVIINILQDSENENAPDTVRSSLIYLAMLSKEALSQLSQYQEENERLRKALNKSGESLKDLCSMPECITNTPEDCSQCYVNDARMVIRKALAKAGEAP